MVVKESVGKPALFYFIRRDFLKMNLIKYIFSRNFERYEGVRPVNIYLLRLFFFLMPAFVATDAWQTLIGHVGPWDNFRALGFCVWAAYATLAVFGLYQPLKWLPIMVFMVFYKSLWLYFVAFPLWRAGTLASSDAEGMASVFMMIPLAAVAIPWIYFFRRFVMGFPALPPDSEQSDVYPKNNQ